MSNREKFKETFVQIEMSEDRLEEIANMEMQNKKKTYLKPMAALAAMVALVLLAGNLFENNVAGDSNREFVAGNITYYAKTGIEAEEDDGEVIGTFLDFKKEHIEINNDVYYVEDVEIYIDENGLTIYAIGGAPSFGVLIEEPEHTSIISFNIQEKGMGGFYKFVGRLKEKDGRIYLRFSEYSEGIDITDDFADGLATGTFESKDTEKIYDKVCETFEYRVEGTLEEYTVDVWWVDTEQNQ